jgi:tetratricopeptide (TPR) repeat protein
MRPAALFLLFLLAGAARANAADQWIEVKSAHFTLTSSASEGATKTLAWQLEQIRSAISVLWPWAKVDLNKPLSVFVVKDETSMRAMAPSYWEQKGGMRPATVWVGGPDQNFLALRADVEARDESYINPYVSSYFSYVSLVLQQSVARPLPLWFSRGLAGVMSNTIVRESKILLGPPIPWHLEQLRDGRRMKLPALLKVTRESREYRNGEDLRLFDAESWALVHFLMFGDNGARWPKLDQFAQMVAKGADPDVAFREALGRPEQLEDPFFVYINRSIYSFRQVNVDAGVKREGFTVTKLSPADAASRRAFFHAAMRRPVEARAAIAEARKAGDTPETHVAEALLLEAEGKTDDARAAYARATEAGTTNPYAYYRLASLMWRGPVENDVLVRIEQLLTKAVSLNSRFAAAYAMVGEARAALNIGDPMSMVLRAISLEPAEAHYHLTAASVLFRQKKVDDAIAHAQTAQALADSEEERRRAAELLERLARAKGFRP